MHLLSVVLGAVALLCTVLYADAQMSHSMTWCVSTRFALALSETIARRYKRSARSPMQPLFPYLHTEYAIEPQQRNQNDERAAVVDICHCRR